MLGMLGFVIYVALEAVVILSVVGALWFLLR